MSLDERQRQMSTWRKDTGDFLQACRVTADSPLDSWGLLEEVKQAISVNLFPLTSHSCSHFIMGGKKTLIKQCEELWTQ